MYDGNSFLGGNDLSFGTVHYVDDKSKAVQSDISNPQQSLSLGITELCSKNLIQIKHAFTPKFGIAPKRYTCFVCCNCSCCSVPNIVVQRKVVLMFVTIQQYQIINAMMLMPEQCTVRLQIIDWSQTSIERQRRGFLSSVCH